MSEHSTVTAAWARTRPARWAAVAIRLLTGAFFLLAGIGKISSVASETAFVAEFLTQNLGVMPRFYAAFVEALALPNVELVFWLVALGELLLGLSLLLGARLRPAGIAGIAMLANFALAKGLQFPAITLDAILVVLLTLLILARAGETWGLDRLRVAKDAGQVPG